MSATVLATGIPTGRPECIVHLRIEPGAADTGILAGLPVPAFVIEAGPDGFRYLHVNGSFAALADLDPDSAGCLLHEALPPCRAETLALHLRAALRRNAPVTCHEVIDRPGDCRHVETRLMPLAQAGDARSRLVVGVSLDMTERLSTERALRDSEQRLRTMFEQTVIGIAFVSAEGRIIEANPSLGTMLGRHPETLEGEDIEALIASDDWREDGQLAALIEGRRLSWQEERRLTGADGTPVWVRINASLAGDGIRHPHRVVMLFEDVTETRRAKERIRFLAGHDPATGLPNLTLFNDRLVPLLERAAAESRPATVLMVGFDRLPSLLLTLEREQADRLVRLAAERLRRALGPADPIGRLTEAWFGVALADQSDPEAVMATVGRIVAGFSAPLAAGHNDLVLSPVIGIGRFPRDADNPDDLIRAAGAALQRAREEPGRGVEFYEPGMRGAAAARLAFEGRLRRAIERSELELVYQPKVDLPSMELCGFEALVRWRDPENGLVSPSHFIPLAEETGLIEPLGELVLDTACRRFADWRANGITDVPVSVNLSARQMSDPDLGRKVMGTLARSGLPAGGLKLELTETSLFHGTEAVRQTLHLLNGAGVGFLLDDFGTGYSSLSYLRRFPIEAVKIDRSFIQTMAQDPGSAAIVHAIINMAHALNMTVVAEGVETQEQLIFLRAYRCDRIQGYLLSRPLDETEVPAFVASRLPA
ncbi:MAG TPA: EAL domain-containing protein [Arenibaculum sp.]|nr:EAL domain-containing protein [Arenibaculum sp.]